MFKRYGLVLVIIFCLLIFAPAIGNFFSGDDWFHLRVVQINNFGQFLNFFSFSETEQSISFYRPLSTQVLFFVLYNLFKLNSVPYFMFGLILFGAILISIFKLIKALGFSVITALIATLIYGASATNFTRINFISAYQELLLTFFVILALIYYLKNKLIYVLFFVLALLSKETAVVFLGLIILIDIYRKNIRVNLKNYLIIGVLSLGYLYLRFFVFKGAVGDSYIWDFSLKKMLNTTMWYGLWSMGTPEFLVDYVGSGLKILPKFFTNIPGWSTVILLEILSFLIVLTCAFLLNLKNFKKISKAIFLSLGIFVITLLPVVFLPWHKFAHALALPLIGFALAASILISSKKGLALIFITLYLALNLTSIKLFKNTYYGSTRGKIAKSVFEYFKNNYPEYPKDKSFRIINDTSFEAKDWGSSKQISYALSGSDFFKVFYKDQKLKVFYEDLDEKIPEACIKISSKQFLK